MIPYMLALCTRGIDSCTGGGRSVLMAVAAIDKKRTLFATCKHAVQAGQVNAFIFDEDVGDVGIVTDAKVAPTPDLDLAFIVVDVAFPANRVRINDARIENEARISHARNVVTKSAREAFQISISTTRQSRFKAVRERDTSFSMLHQPGDLKKAQSNGFQTLYSVLEMQSWPGVSGSPLWDQTGAIRGMVCGGNAEGEHLGDGIPRLVYLPIKKIVKEARQVLRQIL